MADTIGSIIDKLITANNKMFMEQEKLYDIRRMNLEQFKERYGGDKMKDLHDYFIKAADLNLQRNAGIDEIDLKIIEMIKACVGGQDLDNGCFVQRKHKTA